MEITSIEKGKGLREAQEVSSPVSKKTCAELMDCIGELNEGFVPNRVLRIAVTDRRIALHQDATKVLAKPTEPMFHVEHIPIQKGPPQTGIPFEKRLGIFTDQFDRERNVRRKPRLTGDTVDQPLTSGPISSENKTHVIGAWPAMHSLDESERLAIRR